MQELYSKIIGEGKPLLILHGYFGMGDNWKSLATKFSQMNFEVHLIDLRNHGRSFHSEVFNYEVMVADIHNYITANNLEKVSVIGHSMGGKLAMAFAAQYPSIVKKLVVVDISPKYYVPHHNEILAALNAVDFSKQNTRKLVDGKLAEYIEEVGVRQFLLKSVFWKEKGVLDFRFNVKALTVNNKEVGKELAAKAFYLGPTLFLSGENSAYIKEEDVLLIKKHFSNAAIITIPRAGHWLHAENPGIFFDEVSRFLQ
ncbi:alpha/beta fold hydrolase [Tenacibaculum sp. SG-28]|uniref:alpha/beta fold hydrolase n=1 Tax=Tenacibaculum sp. SG-28 TaxID=754426 RepID=UPI000CF53EEF|nr:alpha/beta fold hydrolase [Tenacibaculum sp. SG-28]PQJ22799.1 alpha/beta hydrolase [Tenacibaculum sp. SG-28]